MDTWHIVGGNASFESSLFQADYQLNHPTHGLRLREWPTSKRSVEEGWLFGVDPPGFAAPMSPREMGDYYVRQQDLVVGYERQQPDHLRVQTDWRIREGSFEDPDGNSISCWGVRLLVSLSTNRLDARPTLTVTTHLPADELLTLSARVQPDASDNPVDPTHVAHPIVLFRQDDAELTWVQLVYPTDVIATQVTSDTQGCQARLRLLDEHLEKGVIRRVQLVAWLVPRHCDRMFALQSFHRLLASPPPIGVS